MRQGLLIAFPILHMEFKFDTISVDLTALAEHPRTHDPCSNALAQELMRLIKTIMSQLVE